MVGKAKTLSKKAINFERIMLEKRISEMKDLPTLPHYVINVMELLRDEDVNLNKLVKAIEKDQALVTQILKLINSGYYGLRNTIDTVERSIVLLGTIELKRVIFSAAIIDFFSEDEQLEWLHSYSCSVLMNRLMVENEIPVASNLPMTMLMHDIGKVVMKKFKPQKFQMTRDMAKSASIPLFEAENQVVHINHADIGGIIMEKWQMTNDIIIPIKYHHTYKDIPEEYQLETAMVQIVNYIDCCARGILCPPPSIALLSEVGISETNYDYWISFQKDAIVKLDDIDFTKQ